MDKSCPRCGKPMTHDSVAGVFRCKACGKVIDAPRETLEQAAARLAARGPRPDVKLTHRGEIDSRARTLFEGGQERLWQNDIPGAMNQFRLALEIMPNFADAHLWMAKVSPDPGVKREHLSEIIAHDPGHHEAMVWLMVVDGRITEAEADSLLKRPQQSEPQRKQADQVSASTTSLLCPNCGGHLTVEDNGRVHCRFCGQEVETEPAATLDRAGDVLGAALIERRTKPVRWLIGSRVVHCSQCGAERIYRPDQLSAHCPFCGTGQVMLQDALGTFEQPEGLIPFQVSETEAKAAVREELNSLGERLRGLTARLSQVVSATIEAIYLPYWVFDVLADVHITTQERDNWMRNDRMSQRPINPVQHMDFRDGLTGVFVPAVKSPPTDQLEKLGEFEMDPMRPYEPALLASTAAALYTLEVDRASLEAQSAVSRRIREREMANAGSSETTVTVLPLQMSFMLVLCPVWVATLIERDGDVRTALVHGQTGKVIMGRAVKPEKKGTGALEKKATGTLPGTGSLNKPGTGSLNDGKPGTGSLGGSKPGTGSLNKPGTGSLGGSKPATGGLSSRLGTGGLGGKKDTGGLK